MGSVGKEFKGLPMSDLIGTPLIAAAEAQGKLANITENFIKEVGLNKSGENGDGSFNYEARTVAFKYNLPIIKEGVLDTKQVELEVPLLAIVNVPSLSVKNVTIDFNMEVKTSSKDTSEVNASTTVKVGYSSAFSPVSASVSGSVSASTKSERATDNSAKYSVHVEARDDGPPEGLMKVLDILSSSIPNPSEMLALYEAANSKKEVTVTDEDQSE
jgi:hypothetical protein